MPIAALTRTLPGLPPQGGIEPVSLRALETRLAVEAPPDGVLSPLFWQDGDVMEAARLLWCLEFSGPYRIVSPPLPRPGMVIDEVLAHFPGLDIALVQLPPPYGGPAGTPRRRAEGREGDGDAEPEGNEDGPDDQDGNDTWDGNDGGGPHEG
ncbi:hypothetical protein DLJ49_13715 [Rhodovulum sp. 12E13]|nr:hypothetical protein DLJ49_13715 [Rhodovulum sp. 12E13]